MPIKVGDLSITIDGDLDPLKSSAAEVETQLRKTADAGKPLERQVQAINDAVGGTKTAANSANPPLASLASNMTALAKNGKDAHGVLEGLSSQAGSMASRAMAAAAALSPLAAGVIVIGAVAAVALIALKALADSFVKVGESARFSGIGLKEFQSLQKALEVTGGLSAEKFASGTEAIAKNLFEAGREANDLSKLLDENKVKWGEIGKVTLTVSGAIRTMAELLRNATSGGQQERIIKAFGVGREWVLAAEQGGDAIDRLVQRIDAAGPHIDREMIDKAQKFSQAWRQYTEEASMWIKSWSYSAITSMGKVAEAATPLYTTAARGAGWMADRILEAFQRAFGDEKTKEQIEARREQIKNMMEATYQSPKADEALRNKIAPGPATVDVPKEHEAMEKRLDMIRQMVASEDEVYKIQRERYTKDLDKFEEAKFLSKEKRKEIEAKMDAHYEKKKNDLIFSKLEENTALEGDILRRKHEEQLKLLEVFEKNKTVTQERAEELRKRMDKKYALDRQMLAAKAWTELANVIDTAMSAITSLMSSESQKGFTVLKAIAIATATMKGYEAAVSAWSAGDKASSMTGIPGLGAVYAAISLAGTGALIAKIAGVGEGGGGAAAAASGGGGGGGGSGVPPSQTPGPSSNSTMTVRGLSGKDLFTSEAMRDFAKRLLDFQRDGGHVILR